MRRVNLNLSESVDDKARDFAKEHRMSKSRLFEVAVSQYMSAMEALPSFKDEMTRQIADLQSQIDALGK